MDRVAALFPTPVMHVKQLVDHDLLESMNDDLARQDWFTNKHTDLLTHTEVVKPTSSPIFLKLRKAILPKLVDFGALLFGEALKWHVKECWINVLHKGGHQESHSHANSFISGVVYLNGSHPSSNLVIHRNSGGGQTYMFVNSHETADINPYNAAKWQSDDIEPGDMILFPSYMLHEVPVNQGEKRVSMAFNALPDRLDSWGYKVTFGR
ncbi:MAG: TIGR02466 family protein [Pseudomonadota bacterium]